MRRSDPLIIGGGPAGSAAAILLARGGARPLILERSRETGDALCGGFLSWQTLTSLEQLGVSAEALGGHSVIRMRLFAGQRHVTAPLPGLAIGISRHRLDSLLLDRAGREGARIERGVTVKRFEHGGRVVLGDGSELTGDALLVASGKHDLAGLGRPRATDPALGLRLKLPASTALRQLLAGSIELHLFSGGYAGLVLHEDGAANLCLAVRKSRLSEAGGDPAVLLNQLGEASPALGERLAFAAEIPSIEAIGAVPYGWICRATDPGLFRLGDQAGVIPSLAGEGNGIALASGIRAARALLAGGPAAALPFQQALATSLNRPIARARRLWRAAEAPIGAWLGLSLMQLAPRFAAQLAQATRIGD